MFKVKVDKGTLSYCESVARGTPESNKLLGGNWEELLYGKIGEQVVMDIFNAGAVGGYRGGFDGGFDFTFNDIRTDVKTVGRTVDVKPEYNAILHHSQFKYDCDAYVFCSYHHTKEELTVCGWIPKDDFKKLAVFRKKGEKDGCTFWCDCYTVKVGQLLVVESPQDLYDQFTSYSVW